MENNFLVKEGAALAQSGSQSQTRAVKNGETGSSSQKFCKGFPLKINVKARGAIQQPKASGWVRWMGRGEKNQA